MVKSKSFWNLFTLWKKKRKKTKKDFKCLNRLFAILSTCTYIMEYIILFILLNRFFAKHFSCEPLDFWYETLTVELTCKRSTGNNFTFRFLFFKLPKNPIENGVRNNICSKWVFQIPIKVKYVLFEIFSLVPDIFHHSQSQCVHNFTWDDMVLSSYFVVRVERFDWKKNSKVDDGSR